MPHVRNSFALSGPSRALDPRVNAMRGDLADVALAGKHFSPHYARPVERFCRVPFTPMWDKPDGEHVSELLLGESFMLLDISGGWAWGYSKHDHYVGYVKANAIAETAEPAIILSATDVVEAAKTFLDQPYVWGGRGGAGLDCSGLVQRSLSVIGIAAPRDSDMQGGTVGTILPDDVPLQGGDLVFFPGHVGIMSDGENIIHATIHHGKTVVEPLADIVARLGDVHDRPLLSRKRITQ